MENRKSVAELLQNKSYKYLLNKKPRYNNKIKKIKAIVWINLDRSPERRKYMEDILSNIDIPNYRIPAVDGRNQNIRNMIGNCPLEKKNITNYEIACTLSHIKAINFLKNIKGKYFLICEDDVSFSNTNLFDESLKTIIENSPPFDILMLNKTYIGYLHNLYNPWLDYFFKHDDNMLGSTVSYIISREGIDKITEFAQYNFISDSFTLKKYEINVADIYLYKNTITYAYKYNYLGTKTNQESTIHGSNDVSEHERSNIHQLKILMKEKYNYNI